MKQPNRRGLESAGLRAAIRQQFADGNEHGMAEVVVALADLVPMEIAARRYLSHHRGASWPPSQDDYAAALYSGQRTVILSQLRVMGATWEGREGRAIISFRLPDDRQPDRVGVTRDERRRMVEAILVEFPAKTDRAIALQSGVSPQTVARARTRLSMPNGIDSVRRTERAGTLYEINVTNLGRRKRPPAEPMAPTMTVPVTVAGAVALLLRLPTADRRAVWRAIFDRIERMT